MAGYEIYIIIFWEGECGQEKIPEICFRRYRTGKEAGVVGGGLIRSMGGWFEVLALRRRGEREAADQRILGDGEFVESVVIESEELGKQNLRLMAKRMKLSKIAQKVSKVHDISNVELRSGSRRREVVEARRVLCWLAVRELGYSGAEVSRYLGVTNSCVIRSVSAVKPSKRAMYS